MDERPLFFKNFSDMYHFMKGPKEFKEPERLEEVKDEVPPKQPHKRKSKTNADKVGKSAKDADKS